LLQCGAYILPAILLQFLLNPVDAILLLGDHAKEFLGLIHQSAPLNHLIQIYENCKEVQGLYSYAIVKTLVHLNPKKPYLKYYIG